MHTSTFLSIAASFSSVSASTVYKGFNYGSTFTDGSAKVQSDFQKEFNVAKNLVGATGFTSARLYTMIVCIPSKPNLHMCSLQTSEHLLTDLVYVASRNKLNSYRSHSSSDRRRDIPSSWNMGIRWTRRCDERDLGSESRCPNIRHQLH
jgi:hypothetical protein